MALNDCPVAVEEEDDDEVPLAEYEENAEEKASRDAAVEGEGEARPKKEEDMLLIRSECE
jgi:hypothetical protein